MPTTVIASSAISTTGTTMASKPTTNVLSTSLPMLNAARRNWEVPNATTIRAANSTARPTPIQTKKMMISSAAATKPSAPANSSCTLWRLLRSTLAVGETVSSVST